MKKLWASVEHFWTWFSKLISRWTEVHFEWKRNFRRKEHFIPFSFWAKIFQLLVEKFLTWFLKINFTSPEKHFHDCSFFWKLWSLFTFGDRGKVFRPSGKNFIGMIATTVFYMSIEKVWGWKCNFENNNVFFFTFSDNGRPFLALWENLASWLSKILSRCPLADIEENYFWTKNIRSFITFGHWSKGMFFFSERSIYFLTFWDTDWQKVGLFWEISGRVSQNCFLRVQRFNLMMEKKLK